ncbi:polysulfide reductase NrfD [Halovivax asiaticus JCM 14624]|uniref:Polysulfide reductase NrfD n=1 Tax=Halovivax asiaticus JCM 14624 TaxID=1227490 RepID=M0BUG1_9EURY|nr:NrfD/PsrC family molybdoenzyme membrane anchor subunit [Halovivax asiaticus]ELZ13762.1 polysulfide reductase NrfD [Halovivax asiaticus JCM 14624]
MSAETPSEADILRPINTLTKKWVALVAIAGLAFALFLVGWAYQLQKGLVVTGLGDWGSGGGVTWGVYIGAFIWWVGIAHGGIILSAAVRLLGMERYMPVARMAELLTLGGLSAAGFYILVHMGRPDRMVTSVISHYHITVHNSPLVWDVTVITAYFVLTATYLGLTIRYDIVRLRDDLPDILEPVYKILTFGYSEAEDEIIERMVWWIAAAIIIMAPLLLHGGVIPWLFSLLATYPIWDGGIQGPMFLAIALTSAISGVTIAAAAFTRAYDWHHIITRDIFRGLLLWLGFFSLMLLWFQLQTIINGVYFPGVAALEAAHGKLHAPLYMVSMGLVAGSLMYIFAQALRPELFTKTRAIITAFAVLTATLIEKVLFVVEGFLYVQFSMYSGVPGSYVPSLIEIASILGTIGMVALIFLFVSKMVPIVELHAIEHLRGDHDEHGSTEVEA